MGTPLNAQKLIITTSEWCPATRDSFPTPTRGIPERQRPQSEEERITERFPELSRVSLPAALLPKTEAYRGALFPEAHMEQTALFIATIMALLLYLRLPGTPIRYRDTFGHSVTRNAAGSSLAPTDNVRLQRFVYGGRRSTSSHYRYFYD